MTTIEQMIYRGPECCENTLPSGSILGSMPSEMSRWTGKVYGFPTKEFCARCRKPKSQASSSLHMLFQNRRDKKETRRISQEEQITPQKLYMG